MDIEYTNCSTDCLIVVVIISIIVIILLSKWVVLLYLLMEQVVQYQFNVDAPKKEKNSPIKYHPKR